MKNSQTAAEFDAWIAKQHSSLRQRLMTTCVFDEDAFQETYIAMRETLTPDTTGDFETLFIKLYRQMLACEFRREYRYAHPDPLFFLYLRTEPLEADGEQAAQEQREEVTAKAVDDFVRFNFSAGDYLIFHLKFFAAMTYQGLIDYTGHSSATIARKLNNIKHAVNQRFTPPRFTSCFSGVA